MDAMWLEVVIETTQEELDTVVAKLTMNGVNGLAVEDEEDFKQFLENNRQYWDYVDDELMEKMKGAARVKFYVTDDEDGQSQLSEWMEGIDTPYTTIKLKENDWATSWQKYYQPMAVGEKVYIVPEWEKEAEIPTGKVPLFMNPGLIFGTGSHASTRLCLEGTEQYVNQGDKVLDLGCGSGILSIAALLLGGATAVGVDIDPKAVNVAYENAAMNGILKDRYTVMDGDVIGDSKMKAKIAQEKYDLLLVNIVSDVIIPLSAHVGDLMAEDATILFSGIIDTRAEEVGKALEDNGLQIIEKKERDGWVFYAAKAKKS